MLALALGLTAVGVSTVLAEGQTVTATLKLSIPFVGGETALGTMVIQNAGTAGNMDSHWTFVGQVNGQPATASGTARGRWNGSGYDGSIIAVESWRMGGVPAPKLPLAMSFLNVSGQTVNSSVSTHRSGALTVPLAIQGVNALPAPFQGNLQISATNVTGSEIQSLPRTGATPDWMNLAAVSAILVGILLMLASIRLVRHPSVD